MWLYICWIMWFFFCVLLVIVGFGSAFLCVNLSWCFFSFPLYTPLWSVAMWCFSSFYCCLIIRFSCNFVCSCRPDPITYGVWLVAVEMKSPSRISEQTSVGCVQFHRNASSNSGCKIRGLIPPTESVHFRGRARTGVWVAGLSVRVYKKLLFGDVCGGGAVYRGLRVAEITFVEETE